MKFSTLINYVKLTVKPASQLPLLASSEISSSQPRLSSSFLGKKKKKVFVWRQDGSAATNNFPSRQKHPLMGAEEAGTAR